MLCPRLLNGVLEFMGESDLGQEVGVHGRLWVEREVELEMIYNDHKEIHCKDPRRFEQSAE